jgi:hypothetical protein
MRKWEIIDYGFWIATRPRWNKKRRQEDKRVRRVGMVQGMAGASDGSIQASCAPPSGFPTTLSSTTIFGLSTLHLRSNKPNKPIDLSDPNHHNSLNICRKSLPPRAASLFVWALIRLPINSPGKIADSKMMLDRYIQENQSA